MFGVGDNVICIDDLISPKMLFAVADMYPNWVKKGNKYTIRAINSNDDIVTGLLLEEVRNPEIYISLINKTQEPMFSLHRFAKVEPDASASMYYTETVDNKIYTND